MSVRLTSAIVIPGRFSKHVAKRNLIVNFKIALTHCKVIGPRSVVVVSDPVVVKRILTSSPEWGMRSGCKFWGEGCFSVDVADAGPTPSSNTTCFASRR